MRFLLFLLFPFALLFGLVAYLRNKCYDWGIFKSTSFDFPVISIGNLSMGGTGKTPHVENLIRLLSVKYNVSMLSRGYKRKSKGFVVAGPDSTSADVGDEPLQVKKKFENITVAVDRDRVRGINKIMEQMPDTDVILLDDAFQHRAVKPGLSILLTDFHKLYPEDYPFPVGSLREFRKGARRADIIIVTKTPKVLSPITVRRIAGLIKPREHQKLYFSTIRYGELTPLPGLGMEVPEGSISSILLFAGIANMYPLQDHVSKMCNHLFQLKYGDHHKFTRSDYHRIRRKFEGIFTQNKIIVTTEKDAMRIAYPKIPEELEGLPIYYIPIQTKIHKEFRKDFNDQIRTYVRENTGDSSIHQKENKFQS